MLIALRKRHPALRRRSFFRGRGPHGDLPADIDLARRRAVQPDFSHGSRTLAFALDGSQTGREPDRDFYVACNAWIDTVEFTIPQSPSGSPWRRVIDTALTPPHDILELEDAPPCGAWHQISCHRPFDAGADFCAQIRR